MHMRRPAARADKSHQFESMIKIRMPASSRYLERKLYDERGRTARTEKRGLKRAPNEAVEEIGSLKIRVIEQRAADVTRKFHLPAWDVGRWVRWQVAASS